MYPNGVPASVLFEGRNPFRVEVHDALSPRVARLRGQPWAVRRNSFGVNTAPHNTNLELLRLAEGSRYAIGKLPLRQSRQIADPTPSHYAR